MHSRTREDIVVMLVPPPVGLKDLIVGSYKQGSVNFPTVVSLESSLLDMLSDITLHPLYRAVMLHILHRFV
jgi:hypothetical protein